MARSPPQAPYKRAAGEEKFANYMLIYTILHDFSRSDSAPRSARSDQKFAAAPATAAAAAAAAVLLLLLLLRLRLCRRRRPCHCCRARPPPSAPDRRPAATAAAAATLPRPPPSHPPSAPAAARQQPGSSRAEVARQHGVVVGAQLHAAEEVTAHTARTTQATE